MTELPLPLLEGDDRERPLLRDVVGHPTLPRCVSAFAAAPSLE